MFTSIHHKRSKRFSNLDQLFTIFDTTHQLPMHAANPCIRTRHVPRDRSDRVRVAACVYSLNNHILQRCCDN